MFIREDMLEIKNENNGELKSSHENRNLKRKSDKNIQGDVIRWRENFCRMTGNSPGSSSSSDGGDLLKTMDEPLFTDFFIKKRKLESSDGQSTSSSSPSQDSSEDNSLLENSPEDRRQNADTVNSRDMEESLDMNFQQHKKYRFQNSLDYLSARKFSREMDITFSSTKDSSQSRKKFRTSYNRNRISCMPEKLSQSSSKSSLSNVNESLHSCSTKGFDSFSDTSSTLPSCRNVISPSTSLDGFKRDNSTASESIRSNSSVTSLEAIPQNPNNEGDGRSSSNGSLTSVNSNASSNHRYRRHGSSSISSYSECNDIQNFRDNNSVSDNKNDFPITIEGSQQETGGLENTRSDMYLNAPERCTGFAPFAENKRIETTSRSMDQSIQSGLPHQNRNAYNEDDFFWFQTTSRDISSYGQNTLQPGNMQLSTTYLHTNTLFYENSPNNRNMILNSHGPVEYNVLGIQNFPQVQFNDDKMKRFFEDQRNMQIGIQDQREDPQMTLQHGNQGTEQRSWPIISHTAHMDDQFSVWSGVMNDSVENNIVSESKHQNMLNLQHDLMRNTYINQSNSNFSPQFHDVHQTPSQENFRASSMLSTRNSFPANPTQMNATAEFQEENKSLVKATSPKISGVKEPKSQVAFIALAIMSQPDCRMTLFEIYQYIETNHQQYLRRQDWRNGVRHTLSHNVCFIKKEKAGHRPRKGHYWSIHPACIKAFKEGIFCLRHSKRLVMAYKNPCASTGIPQQQKVLMDTHDSNQ
ncbi:hypothetical protein FSP39_021964 [Pinctada imbricata]|uniref:Fork-head domain-containing protein n=1 Tax=Pinctada imbricata TaxID=66713 RepID=A0AA88XLN9_PINIB|nr:hypothetical protein FSP39_021964 [Pinctada imbricata]